MTAPVQTMTQPAPSRRSARRPYSVLIADTSAEARNTIEQSLANLGPQTVDHAEDGDQLERLFFDKGPYDLVVCRALLGARSGLQVLAKARTRGRRASFIVYSTLEGPWLRVFVSDSDATVLSSRVVSLEGLAHLAEGMVEAKRR
jgi:CheY-like chemotaxis protein